jgi:hypothetical protein
VVTRACKAQHGIDAVQQWWQLAMCNKQTPALGTRNKKQKLQKLWKNSLDPLSFVGYYDRGRRESERGREREKEKRRKRERRARKKRLHCKKTTQTAHSWTLSSGSCSHLCQVHQLLVGYSLVTDKLTDWLTCWINILDCMLGWLDSLERIKYFIV